MSFASELRAHGFDQLLRLSGDDLQFRGAPLRAVIDFGRQQGRDVMEVGLSLLSTSEIEFRKDAITGGMPNIGEVLEDEEGQRHRITLVRQSKFTWRVMCEVSS